MDINDIDFENIAIWPLPVKIVAIMILCGLIMFLGYYFDISKQKQALEKVQSQEKKLKREFEKKQKQAANLEAYKAQMAEINKIFKALLGKLPERTEVPGLVEDISHIGLANGLEFKTIKLRPEIQRDFYTELPIEISVVGSYHDIGNFVSDVSALPRIVTLHDFTLGSAVKDGNGNTLMLNIIAKTYRYASEGG